MSKKWLKHEGLQWIERGIISTDQYDQILSLYEEKSRTLGLLPILASILVGVGILSFIASNWQGIHELLRLTIILIALIGFYVSGMRFYDQGATKMGISLISIGLVLFGAGIILLGQTFHLVTYDATAFILWSLAGVSLLYLFKSRLIFLLTLVILQAAQIYSLISFNHFSYISFFILIIGLGVYWWTHKGILLTWLYSISILFQFMFFVLKMEWPFTWVLLGAMALYVTGDWSKEKDLTYPMQSAPLITGFGFATFFVFFLHEFDGYERIFDLKFIYFITALILFTISLLGKRLRNDLINSFDWIVFLPFFYLYDFGGALFYLLVLFFYSGYLLWIGYREEWSFKVNLGTVLFLLSTLIGYTQVAWSFMPKSLFFLMGGLLLFLLSYVLERKRRRFIAELNSPYRPSGEENGGNN